MAFAAVVDAAVAVDDAGQRSPSARSSPGSQRYPVRRRTASARTGCPPVDRQQQRAVGNRVHQLICGLKSIRQHTMTLRRTSDADGVFSPACSGVAEPNAEEVPDPTSWWPLMPAEPGVSRACPGDVDGFDCCCCCVPSSPVACWPFLPRLPEPGLVCIRKCRVSSSEREKRFSHPANVHACGFSPVWMRACRVWLR